MAVRESEKYLPDTLAASDLGQASTASALSGGSYALVSYLTSPVRTGTALDYVVFALGGADADEYHWLVETASGTTVHDVTTEIGVFRWTPSAADAYNVSVQVKLDDDVEATLQLLQTAQLPNDQLEERYGHNPYNWDFLTEFQARLAPTIDTLREMVNDLKPYMVAAVASTGANGIPLRLLAAVLFPHIRTRPKEGTAVAEALRKEFGEQTWSSFWPRFKQVPGPSFYKWLHEPFDVIRDVEIELVAEILDEENWVVREFIGGKSLGVGQIAQSTAAMTLGKIPWQDADPADLETTREAIDDDYAALSLEEKAGIFNRLRFPKTNVELAATLLAKLKNRANRWPTLTASDLATKTEQEAIQSAIAVIATEYNLGSTSSSQANAKPNRFGTEVAMNFVRDQGDMRAETFFQ